MQTKKYRVIMDIEPEAIEQPTQQSDDAFILEAAKLVMLKEENLRLRSDNEFYYAAYLAMCEEYNKVLVEKREAVNGRKLTRRIFRKLFVRYQQIKKRCNILEEWKAHGYVKLKKMAQNPNEVAG